MQSCPAKRKHVQPLTLVLADSSALDFVRKAASTLKISEKESLSRRWTTAESEDLDVYLGRSRLFGALDRADT